MTTYTVRAIPGDDAAAWVFQCVEAPGAIDQGDTLDEAFEYMPEAIAFVADVPVETVKIRLVAEPDAVVG